MGCEGEAGDSVKSCKVALVPELAEAFPAIRALEVLAAPRARRPEKLALPWGSGDFPAAGGIS